MVNCLGLRDWGAGILPAFVSVLLEILFFMGFISIDT